MTYHLARLNVTYAEITQMRADLLVAIRRANSDKAMK